jgi:hypothetical protein
MTYGAKKEKEKETTVRHTAAASMDNRGALPPLESGAFRLSMHGFGHCWNPHPSSPPSLSHPQPPLSSVLPRPHSLTTSGVGLCGGLGLGFVWSTCKQREISEWLNRDGGVMGGRGASMPLRLAAFPVSGKTRLHVIDSSRPY